MNEPEQHGQMRHSVQTVGRGVPGSANPLRLYRIDETGKAHEAATLYPTRARGCVLEMHEPFDWPLEQGPMAEGHFDGLPYFLDDMRPQGFLGRHFARTHSDQLQVSPDPGLWSDDDVMHALCLLGSDGPGQYVLGDQALRVWQQHAQDAMAPLRPTDLPSAYPVLAEQAVTHRAPDSFVGGEVPKFTAVRAIDDAPVHVIVKFSGACDSPGSKRWSDLLVCEYLAQRIVAEQLNVTAATSHLHQFDGRTFLEMARFTGTATPAAQRSAPGVRSMPHWWGKTAGSGRRAWPSYISLDICQRVTTKPLVASGSWGA